MLRRSIRNTVGAACSVFGCARASVVAAEAAAAETRNARRESMG
jgi:hypothetical protein